MKLKFPITKHIRAELNKAGIVRLRNVRVDEDSYTELRQLVEGGGYAHLSDEERHAITVGCCLTHPNHRKKHQFPWLAACILGVAAILLLLFAVSAKAQGTSQIDVITFRDNSGVPIKSFAAPFSIKCGANLTCTASGSVLTFAGAGGSGSPAGVTANVQYNNGGSFGAIADGALGQILIAQGAGNAPVFADPTIQGTQAPGSATIPNPIVGGGSDYGGTPAVRAQKVDSSGSAYIALVSAPTLTVNLPQQAFLNTQMFSDTNAASPTRGDIITAQGATPKWNRLAVGTSSQALFGGTEPAWGTTTLLNGGFHSDTTSGSVTSGDVIRGDSTPKWSRLASPTTTSRATLVALPTYQSVPAAPSLTVQNGGGTIAQNTTVFVQIKLKYPNGDTGPSIETSILTSAANGCTASCTVTVALNASICQPTANGQTATGCDVYDATASGAELKQTTLANCQNIAANCVIGTVGAGAAITTINAATIVQPVQWKQEIVRRACDFPGATAGVQIQNAINDLPTGSFGAGGIVDATCYGGTTQVITSQILLGDATRTVTLIVDRATFYDVGVTGGIDVFKIGPGSGIMGVGVQGNAFGNGGGFYLDGANISSLFTNSNKTSLQQNMFIKGIVIDSFGGAVVSNAIIWLQDLADTTKIEDVTIIGCPSICLELQSVANLVGPADLSLHNVWVDGQGNSFSGAKPVVFRPNTGTGVVQIAWFGGSIVGAGAGNVDLDIDCQGLPNCYNMLFSAIHMETATAITDMVKVRDTFNVIFDSIDVAGGGTCTNMFNVSQSAANLSHDVQFRAIRGGLCTNTINDNGVLVTNTQVANYCSNCSNYTGPGLADITGDSGAINTAETVIVKTPTFRANSMVAGTHFRIRLTGTCTSTVANTSTFTIRWGTAGTTADGSVVALVTSAAATSGTNNGFTATIDFTVRTIGATATSAAMLEVISDGNIGIVAVPNAKNVATSAFNTTTANAILSVSYKSAATTTTSTFKTATIERVYQ